MGMLGGPQNLLKHEIEKNTKLFGGRGPPGAPPQPGYYGTAGVGWGWVWGCMMYCMESGLWSGWVTNGGGFM